MVSDSTSAFMWKRWMDTVCIWDWITRYWTIQTVPLRSTLRLWKKVWRWQRRKKKESEMTTVCTSARSRLTLGRTLESISAISDPWLKKSETLAVRIRNIHLLLTSTRRYRSVSGIWKCDSGDVCSMSTMTMIKSARRKMTARKPLKSDGTNHPRVVAAIALNVKTLELNI